MVWKHAAKARNEYFNVANARIKQCLFDYRIVERHTENLRNYKFDIQPCRDAVFLEYRIIAYRERRLIK